MLHTLTREIDTMIRVRSEQKGLAYSQQIAPDIPDHLIGDELRVRQILINLLNNAVKYTDSGEVKLEISPKNISEDTVELCICVKDTGIGIRSEDIPYIFGDFKRLDDEHNHRIEGTGLGLSIVKRMTELIPVRNAVFLHQLHDVAAECVRAYLVMSEGLDAVELNQTVISCFIDTDDRAA